MINCKQTLDGINLIVIYVKIMPILTKKENVLVLNITQLKEIFLNALNVMMVII